MSASVPYPPDTYAAESYPPVAGTAPDPVERSAWWLALGASVLGVVIGVVMIVWPTATLHVVAALFGIWLLLHGVVRIVQAISGRGRDGAERALLGVIGVFFVIAGVVALRNLLVSLTLVVTVIGLMWLLGGIMEVISAIGGSRGGYRAWHVVLGLLSIAAGLVVLIWPDLSLQTLVYITGAWLIVMGLIQVALVVWARRALTAAAA
jgi:uncharacterized membrane protein HdeD (DUF308 family)